MLQLMVSGDATSLPRERMIALIVTVAVHLFLLGWLIQTDGRSGRGFGADVAGAGSRVAVTFIKLSPVIPERSPVQVAISRPEVTDPADGKDIATMKATSAAADAHRVSNNMGEMVPPALPQTQVAQVAQTAAAVATTANGGSDGGGEDDLLARYHVALRARIARSWNSLTDRAFPSECGLHLTQTAGGAVIATSASNCALSREDRLQLEAAALMAQPLPYAGYEAVFAPELTLDL